MANARRSDNKSGEPGVKRTKWGFQVVLKEKGVYRAFGTYGEYEDAVEVSRFERQRIHGDFA
jgi:hypothetical protein